MYQDTTWYGCSPQPIGDTVLDWDLVPPPLKGHSLLQNFWPMSQTAGWTKMPLGMEIGLGPGDFVFDGDPAPQKKRAQAPIQFLTHVYCGQKAGWINMPLGTEVNLGPGDVMLDGGRSSP